MNGGRDMRQAKSAPRREGKKWFVVPVVGALALLFGWSGIAVADDGRPQANPEEKAAALIRPAVMYLEAEAEGWVRLPTGEQMTHFSERTGYEAFTAGWRCTGFVVNPAGWVATAGHCVDPEGARKQILIHAAKDYFAANPDSEEAHNPGYWIQWLLENGRVEGKTADRGPEIAVTAIYGTGTNGTAAPASIEAYLPFEKGDIGLLKVQKDHLPSSQLATDQEVNIGTPVLSVGFPGSTEQITDPSLDPTNKSGKVSKKSTTESIPQYEIDADISPGMSGGPTINLDGKVIGVNSFRPANEPGAFNFIAPADRLAETLAGKGIKAELGPADMSYRSGLNNYFDGRYSAAIKDFDRTLSLSPEYPGVADLKTNAVNLREQYGDSAALPASDSAGLAIFGVLLALVVGGGVAAVVLLRNRRARAAGPAQPFPAAAGGPWSGAGPAAWQPPPAAPPPGTPGAGAEPAAGAPTLTEPHFCPHCGTEHHPDEKYCPNCGQQIT